MGQMGQARESRETRQTSVWRWWAAMAMALFGACDLGVDPPAGPWVGARSAGVELIGVSGRRLGDGDVYRVPLDSGREVLVGARVREAMAIRNASPAVVRVDAMIVPDGPEAQRAWALLGPTRAREVPWVDLAGEIEVAPGGQVDFDVRFAPREVGASGVWLVVGIDRLRWGEREVRWVRLEATARARDSPGGTDAR